MAGRDRIEKHDFLQTRGRPHLFSVGLTGGRPCGKDFRFCGQIWMIWAEKIYFFLGKFVDFGRIVQIHFGGGVYKRPLYTAQGVIKRSFLKHLGSPGGVYNGPLDTPPPNYHFGFEKIFVFLGKLRGF